MKRRTIVRGAAMVGAAGAATFAELLRGGLLDAALATQDWDQVVADFTERMVTAPSAEYGAQLSAHLVTLESLIADKATDDRLRALTQLSHLYGMWNGNTGDLKQAHLWYRTSVLVSDRVGHRDVRAFVRARTAVRGPYEGGRLVTALDFADEALALSSQASVATLEAHAAQIHVHALTGNRGDGWGAVHAMKRVAEALPSGPAGPAQRTASFASYFACRAGTWREARREYDEAEPILRSAPTWHADAGVYFGRAMVRNGDVGGGIAYALGSVRSLRHDVRVIALGVRDLVDIVPVGYTSEALTALKAYASADPGPWENLR